MTMLLKRKIIWLIPLFMFAIILSIFSVQAQANEPEIVVYTPEGSEIPVGGTYDFGTTVVGAPLTRTFTVANEGTALLTNNGWTLSNFEIDRGASNLGPIPPGETRVVTLRCPADTSGTITGYMSIDNLNDADEPTYLFNLTCTVTPPAPEIVVYAPGGSEIPVGGTYDFGTTAFGAPLTRTFTVANEGTALLTNNGWTLSNFEIDRGASNLGPIPPGETRVVTLRCPADAPGTITGYMSIDNLNDADEPTYLFNLTCTVTPPAPDITVYAPDGITLIPDAGSHNLTVTVGTLVSHTFTIANEGTDALNLGAITVPAGMTLVSPPAASVGASNSTTFAVQCDTSAVGVFSGTLSIPSDDPDENPYDFAISCTVTNQPVIPTPTPVPAPASYPTPPPTDTCMDHNFVADSAVRAGAPGEWGGQVYCRVLVQDGRYPTYLGYDLTNAGNIGIQALVDLGIQQAVDIFSPSGANYYQGGIVICLRGQGHLIYLNANRAPRIAEIVGSYTVPEFPGFTCITLFEPGTLVLVRNLPESPA